MPRPPSRRDSGGAQFIVGSGVAGAGVLRFRSPNTAWTLDGTANVSISSSDEENDDSSTDYSSASVSTSVGLRRYDAPHGSIRTFRGAGVTAALTRDDSDREGDVGGGLVEQTASTYRLGAFGELGASYFVTPHLALGARGVATAGYQRNQLSTSSSATASERTSNGGFIQLGSAQLQVTLLF